MTGAGGGLGGAGWEIRTTDVLAGLRNMPDACVQVCITSPPYFGLRSYQTAPVVWGGDPLCTHTLSEDPARRPMTGGTGETSGKQLRNNGSQFGNAWVDEGKSHQRIRNGQGAHGLQDHGADNRSPALDANVTLHPSQGATCSQCSAWLGELGSEPTPDLFVAHLVEVFRECRRVMRDDAVLAVNLGDSYAGSGKGPTGHNGLGDQAERQGFVNQRNGGAVPAKSLCLIPERFSLAMLSDGWTVRSRMAGIKVAPMPESTRDRPTSAWEHVYLFSKRPKYYWDQDAVRSSNPSSDRVQPLQDQKTTFQSAEMAAHFQAQGSGGNPYAEGPTGYGVNPAGANMRNWFYWRPGGGSVAGHFAQFPPSLPEMFIKAASRPGDLVLDCFSGSGTTCLVANRLGRRAIGLELNPEYAAASRDRIQNDAPLCHAIAAAGPAVQQREMFEGGA